MGRLLLEPNWRDFARWCRARGLRPLPAHPWTVAAYVRWCERRQPYAEIVQAVKAITFAHKQKAEHSPESDPTVRRTLRAVGAFARGRKEGSALFQADISKSVASSSAPEADDAPAAGRKLTRLRSRPRLVARRPPDA